MMYTRHHYHQTRLPLREASVAYAFVKGLMELLGLNIAYYRKLNDLTQENLAERIDISRSHLANIETAAGGHPSLEIIFDIADALKVGVSELFEVR